MFERPKETVFSSLKNSRPTVIGAFQKSTCYYTIYQPGTIIGQEIEIPDAPVMLDEIRLSIKTKGPLHQKYRLYLYSMSPSGDSLNNPIILKDVVFSFRSDSITQFADMKRYKIALPYKRFFIGLEVINTDSISKEAVAFSTSCEKRSKYPFLTRKPFSETNFKKAWTASPEGHALMLSLTVSPAVIKD